MINSLKSKTLFKLNELKLICIMNIIYRTSMQEVINCISKDKSNRCLYIAINNIDRQSNK